MNPEQRLMPPVPNIGLAKSLEAMSESEPLRSFAAAANPLLAKATMCSTCIIGFWASVKLMEQFGDTLKPLVLAVMLAGCLEKAVELCEFCLNRLGSLLWCALQCRCSVQPCYRIFRKFQRPVSNPTTPGGLDHYTTLEALQREEETCIPEDAFAPWTDESAGAYFLARLISIAAVLTLVGLFLLQVSASLIASVNALDIHVYKKGYQEIEAKVLQGFDSASPKVKDNLSRQLESLQQHLSSIAVTELNAVLAGTTSFFVQIVMFMLYAFMWLLSPVRSGEHIFQIVRTYFMYKAFCNALFAVCVWCLLTFIRCDLVIVISILCFFLGFIPEVGAFISLAVPLPLLVLDSRQSIEMRATNALTAVVGMLAIKFVVSNGIESFVMARSPVLAGQVDEHSKSHETHPVLILFAVVLSGNIWGVTGMLISVPMLSLARFVLNLETTKEAVRAVQIISPRRLPQNYISEMATSARNSKTFSRESSNV
mmetsp:Transcript_119324/g.283251  ORF Transcript_119324/g.283251 Transcript_119324/m.283251 type:complete len:483 (+) Transcript_119324:12-1460(+)